MAFPGHAGRWQPLARWRSLARVGDGDQVSTVLVTGGAGFIGTNFVRYWREQHPDDRVIALDALTYAGVRENVDGLDGVTFVHADIGDTDAVAEVLERHDVDVIVNFAAESHNSLAVLD